MKPSDNQFEQHLRQHLQAPPSPVTLRRRIAQIPAHLPQTISPARAPLSLWDSHWLMPSLATSATILGFVLGLQDLLGTAPTDNGLLVSLFYAQFDLTGLTP